MATTSVGVGLLRCSHQTPLTVSCEAWNKFLTSSPGRSRSPNSAACSVDSQAEEKKLKRIGLGCCWAAVMPCACLESRESRGGSSIKSPSEVIIGKWSVSLPLDWKLSKAWGAARSLCSNSIRASKTLKFMESS
ncbi:hypothetical protein HYQ46_008557 [Verticillium longisporum]|nr:hypothetical protein HYQ46_008557 [Verticillium longisporum]